MTDAVRKLAELLREIGAQVTMDPGRNLRHPCTFCGAPAPRTGHTLYDIGRYANGEILTRPACARCAPLAEQHQRQLRSQ